MTAPTHEAHDASAIRQFVDLVSGRWRWLLAGAVLGVVVAAALTAATEDVYEAEARLYVNIPAATGIQEALQGVQLSAQLLASYAEIGESRAVAAEVSRSLDGDLSTAEVIDQVSVGTQAPTLLLTLHASSESPETAVQLADAAAEALIAQVEVLEAGRQDPIQAQLIDAATLPADPTEPRPARNLVLGLGLGTLAGLAAALAAQTLDRSVRTIDDVEAATRSPALGVIPRDRNMRRSRLANPDGAAAEAFRGLRTSVRFAGLNRSLDSIVVTSAHQQEGKSTTAANLARTCAADGLRVVIVDADLRRPVLHDLFGIGNDVGLADVLAGKTSLSDAVVTIEPTLRVLPAGTPVEQPTELLGDRRTERVLQQLSLGADLVIFDAAPVLPVTDAVVLASMADAVVLVSRAQRTERIHLAEARDRLDVVGARVLGCVLNGVKHRGRQYYTYRPFER